MNLSKVAIREAVPGDGTRLVELMEQLGYAVTADEIASRLARMRASKCDWLLVACWDDDIVGSVLATAAPRRGIS